MAHFLLFTLFAIGITTLMSFLARAAGGGDPAKSLDKELGAFGRSLPEYIWAAMLTVPPVLLSMSFLWYVVLTAFILSGLCAYSAMQTGHGNVLHWGKDQLYTLTRNQGLTPIVDFIYKAYNKLAVRIKFLSIINKGDINYCRLFMAVKGFWVGLTVLPLGPFLMFFLWPLAYDIGRNRENPNHALAEYLSGLFMGIVLAINIIFIYFIIL